MLSVSLNTVSNAHSETVRENQATDIMMNKNNIPTYEIESATLSFVLSIIASGLDTDQLSFDLRQDFLSER
jgi:hypothetical protein